MACEQATDERVRHFLYAWFVTSCRSDWNSVASVRQRRENDPYHSALSVIFLLLIIQHDLRWILLGPDYSNRLYTTIEVNALLAVASVVYSGIRRGWMALAASMIAVLAWLWVGAINSVV